jgi:hypothetical protein
MTIDNSHFYCDYCNTKVGDVQLKTYLTMCTPYIERGRKGHFCNKECYDKYAKQFEVKYKDKIMYKIGDNEYVPYLDCHYYFKTTEDCYQRMCHKDLAILP